MLTVWCVWWRDPANPDKYDEYSVQRLQRTVAENLSIPHEFICISKEHVGNLYRVYAGIHTLPRGVMVAAHRVEIERVDGGSQRR